ncbi:acyl carrier protein [Christensenellaceae bacterium OttesenSCG-928-K19]|nr:acyl carrier protein [Christensenellaceae bacterium OttesenSCG-928-K19]
MFEQVKKILQEYACVEEGLIRPESHLQNDLFLNSLDVVNVIVEFEEEFGIEVDEADIHSFATVSDVVNYIQAKTKSPSACTV